MDPTQQRRHKPLKAGLDAFVLTTSTYVVPAVAAGAVLLALEPTDAHLLAVLGAGVAYYWGTALEATTAYRRHLAVPRAIDHSVDPLPGKYIAVWICSCLMALPLPVLLFVWVDPSQACSFAIVGSVLLWLFVGLREFATGQRYGHPYIEGGSRGPRIKPVRLLRQVLRGAGSEEDPYIWWGGLKLPLSTLLTNFLVLGAVGTGKTLILRAFLACVLPLVVRYGKWRAMIIDPKSELAPLILGLIPHYKLRIVNAGDARTHAWAVCQDLRLEKDFHEAAHIIIPQIEESQPFFTDGARALAQGAMMALSLQAPDDWWFSDVMFAIRSAKRLETILRLHPSTRDVFHSYAANKRVWLDVYSTLASRVADLYPVAAVWQSVQKAHPNRTFSLTDWVHGNHVLLVGKQASAGKSQGRIIELLLKRASQLLLDGPTNQSTLPPETSRRTIIAIDEAPRVGKLDTLELVTNGRDYGVGVLCASQSIDALLAHYKEADWEALANEFHSLALLSCNSPRTLKWMSDRLGNTDGRLPQSDKPRKPRAQGDWSPTLDPSQFHMLRQGQKTGPACIPGIFQNSQLGTWYADEGVDLPAALASVPSHVPVPDAWQTLRPWDDDDLERLNLAHLRDELDLDSDDGGTAPVPSTPRPPRTRPPKTAQASYPRYRP